MRICDRSQLLANYIKSCEEGLSAELQVSRKTNLIVPDYFVSDYNLRFVSITLNLPFKLQTLYYICGVFFFFVKLLFKSV